MIPKGSAEYTRWSFGKPQLHSPVPPTSKSDECHVPKNKIRTMKLPMFMRTIIAIVLASFATAAFAADINGKWKATMPGPDGSGGMELVFAFKVDGKVLTGSVTSEMSALDIQNGKVDGEKFTFDVAVNEMTIKHACSVVSNDEITMDIEGFGPNTTTKLTRVKEAAPAKTETK
jgi:hypothetical protein